MESVGPKGCSVAAQTHPSHRIPEYHTALTILTPLCNAFCVPEGQRREPRAMPTARRAPPPSPPPPPADLASAGRPPRAPAYLYLRAERAGRAGRAGGAGGGGRGAVAALHAHVRPVAAALRRPRWPRWPRRAGPVAGVRAVRAAALRDVAAALPPRPARPAARHRGPAAALRRGGRGPVAGLRPVPAPGGAPGRAPAGLCVPAVPAQCALPRTRRARPPRIRPRLLVLRPQPWPQPAVAARHLGDERLVFRPTISAPLRRGRGP